MLYCRTKGIRKRNDKNRRVDLLNELRGRGFPVANCKEGTSTRTRCWEIGLDDNKSLQETQMSKDVQKSKGNDVRESTIANPTAIPARSLSAQNWIGPVRFVLKRSWCSLEGLITRSWPRFVLWNLAKSVGGVFWKLEIKINEITTLDP